MTVVEKMARAMAEAAGCDWPWTMLPRHGHSAADMDDAKRPWLQQAEAALASLTLADLAALIRERSGGTWQAVPVEALRRIATRDFNCMPHQHSMAAACLAEELLAAAPTPHGGENG